MADQTIPLGPAAHDDALQILHWTPDARIDDALLAGGGPGWLHAVAVYGLLGRVEVLIAAAAEGTAPHAGPDLTPAAERGTVALAVGGHALTLENPGGAAAGEPYRWGGAAEVRALYDAVVPDGLAEAATLRIDDGAADAQAVSRPTAIETLLPSNATALERVLEAAPGARVEGMPVLVDDLWRPDACPENALPWLAWALSVDRWDPDWPTDVKRLVVADSVGQHRRKGTLSAVRRALDDVGAVYDIVENPNGERFRIAVGIFNSGSLLTGAIPQVQAQIDESKRLSVHVDVTATTGFAGSVELAGGLGLVQVATFEATA